MNEYSSVVNLLQSFIPSQTALLDWLRPHTDNSLLSEIANADYGLNKAEFFNALKRIHEGQQIPVPLQRIPGEVLELMRWTEPDDPQSSNSKGMRGHLLRAFCCAVLLQAADEQETRVYMLSEDSTLVQLLASVLYLGHAASESALRFLSWRVLRQSYDEDEAPFFALALLFLTAALYEPHRKGTELKLLADWALREEEQAPMGRQLGERDLQKWRKLAKEVMIDTIKPFPTPAVTAMQTIFEGLVPEKSQ